MMDYTERNYKLLEKQIIKTIDNKIDFGKKLIDMELSSGIFDVIVKPIVQSFYNFWSNDARKGILQQIKIVLGQAKILLDEQIDDEKFKIENEKAFIEYLKGDQLSRACNKVHENYQELKTILKDVFLFQIKESKLLLSVKTDVDDYNGLIKAAFHTKEDAHDTLTKQLDSYDECMNIIGKDLSILAFPAGRKRIFKVLVKGSEESRKSFLKDLDLTYN